MLGQREDKNSRVIAYASSTLNAAQVNYTATEKEFYAVVYALEKFRPYLLDSKITVYTDYAAVRYLFSKDTLKTTPFKMVSSSTRIPLRNQGSSRGRKSCG